MAEELDAQWEINISVPMRLPGELRDELFSAVVRAVADWEPDERDGWDADVAGCPAAEWPDIVDMRASRQAWAEEAMRLDVEADQLRDELREERIWREDLMREMSGLDPDRPIAKTSRRYQRERDDALDEVARLRKQVSCGCPSEPNPDPTGAVLPCGHRTPRSSVVSSSVLPDGEAQ